MKLSDKQKYTLYIGIVLIILMILFIIEFFNFDEEYLKEIETKNIKIYSNNI